MTKIAIPKTADELEEMLGDASRMQSVFSDKALFGEFIGNYARTVVNADASIATQVKEETQRVLAQWLKDNPDAKVQRLNLDPNAAPVAGLGAKYSKSAPGAKSPRPP